MADLGAVIGRRASTTPYSIRYTPPMWILAWLACAPGELQWPGGREPLRTAWWQRVDFGETERVRLALSTSSFPCALSLTGTDPAAIAEEQLALTTATCREGARHVLLDLWSAGGDPVGAYPGRSGGDPAEIGALGPFSTASHVAVVEAGVLYVDGINRSYAPLEGGAIYDFQLGDGGEAEVDAARDGMLEGAFTFPEISGQFRAEECPAGPLLLDDLFDAIETLATAC